MGWFKAPRSLFYQLLLFFGLPLLALGGISIYTHYFSAMSAATLAYDRTLLASARTVAERLVVRNQRLEVDVPYVVLDSFERNMNDRLYYQVISPRGGIFRAITICPRCRPIFLVPTSIRLWCIFTMRTIADSQSAWRRCSSR